MKLADEIVAEMFADYQRLRSLKKTAALHGRKWTTMWKLFVYRGFITPGSRELPEELVAAMWHDYQRGLSLEEVGKEHGRTRQSIFGIFQKRGFKLRSKVLLPVVEYKGRRYTCQKTCGKHRYLRDTINGRRGDRTKYLHHVIWEEHYGPIPRGHKVAFKDGNHLNFAIGNLELLTNSEQVRKYACKGRNQFTVTAKPRLESLLRNFETGGTMASRLKGVAA